MTEQPIPAAPDENDASAPDENSASAPNGADSWRTRVRTTILGADADDTNEFPHDREELEGKLKTADPELAMEILDEARETWSTMVDGRVENVERRAATLQGVVAIAATFTLTGGTLIIAQIHGRVWRGMAGVMLLICVALLALCGWLATQASSQYRRWVIHPRQAIFTRPEHSTADARIARAASFLYLAGNNSKHARWKVTKLRKAVSYLKLALAALVAFAALMLVYAAAGPQPASSTSERAPGHQHREVAAARHQASTSPSQRPSRHGEPSLARSRRAGCCLSVASASAGPPSMAETARRPLAAGAPHGLGRPEDAADRWVGRAPSTNRGRRPPPR